MSVPDVPSSNHHGNPHSLILNAPYRLQLLADGQPYDMLTFGTREELKEVMAFVDAMKERTRERNERTRTANLEDLPTLARFIVSEFAKTQLPDSTQPLRDGMIPDTHVMIEHCDIQQTLSAPSTCLYWYGDI